MSNESLFAYQLRDTSWVTGRELPPVGMWTEHAGPIAGPLAPTDHRQRAFEHPFDAIALGAGGNTLCLVELGGDILRRDLAITASRRRIVRCASIADTLRCFARSCAMKALPLWSAPSEVMEYLATGAVMKRESAWDAASVMRISNVVQEMARHSARAAAHVDPVEAAYEAARSFVQARTADAWSKKAVPNWDFGWDLEWEDVRATFKNLVDEALAQQSCG